MVVVGDRLVKVNNRSIVNEGSDVVDIIINTSKECGKTVELEFLNMRQLSLAEYKEALAKRKTYYDPLGFPIVMADETDNGKAEKSSAAKTETMEHHIAIEKIWFQYMKSIGGPENLKPVGVFTPSDDLCELVRRGVPIAYRALIWNKISLSDIERRKYPVYYYQQLLARVETEMPVKAGKEINNDIDR